jgi:hypothetical protein
VRTPEMLSATRHVFLCINKKIIQSFSGVFDKNLEQMCKNYIYVARSFRRSFVEGVLILIFFRSIDSEFKNKDGCNI